MKTVQDDIRTAYESRISRNPDGDGGTAVIERGTAISYAELFSAADIVAEALRNAGLTPGSHARLACLGSDSAGYVAVALGILVAGGALVSAGVETPSSEFLRLIDRTHANFAVLERKQLARDGYDKLFNMQEELVAPLGAEFALFKIDASFGCSATTVVDNANRATIPLHGSTKFDGAEFCSLNPAFVRFSSGTTGEAKGVALSHETIIERTEAVNSAFALDESDTILWLLPMAHHFAATIMLFLRKGCALDIAVNDPPEKILARLADGSATFAYATPYHYAKLAATAATLETPFKISDNVKLMITTAMPLTREVSSKFAANCGRLLNQAYGIIECGLPCVNIDPANVDETLSVGVSIEGFEIVINGDGNEQGEILVRGPGLFDAYLSPWTLRNEVLDEDGWFHTGDLGRIDGNNQLHITGRSKSVINFLGLKIFPEKVEAVLNSHPGIVESRIRGIVHDDFGEIPVAEFVPVGSAAIPNQVELTRFCAAELAAHEIPQEFTSVESIPKTPSGKISRS